MRKSLLLLLIIALIDLGAGSAQAQQTGKIRRIGFLSGGVPGSSRGIELFQREFRELGYVEGKNIAFEYRYAEDKPDRSPALADELVRLKVDVIVAGGTTDTLAAKNATTTIPIVFLGKCLILLRLGWLTAWRGPGGTSRGSRPSRRCWLANDWSY